MRHVRKFPKACQAYTLLILATVALLPDTLAAQGRTTLHFGYSKQWVDQRAGSTFTGGTFGIGLRFGRAVEVRTAVYRASSSFEDEPSHLTSLDLGVAFGRFGGKVDAGLGVGLGGWYRSEYDDAGGGGLGYVQALVRWWPTPYIGVMAEGMLRSLSGGYHGMGGNQVLTFGVVLRPGG
jgi:hypothetical protein